MYIERRAWRASQVVPSAPARTTPHTPHRVRSHRTMNLSAPTHRLTRRLSFSTVAIGRRPGGKMHSHPERSALPPMMRDEMKLGSTR